MRVSVIVPVYNEEKTVAQVLEMLSQVALDLDVIGDNVGCLPRGSALRVADGANV